eukprot:gene8749-9643_t
MYWIGFGYFLSLIFFSLEGFQCIEEQLLKHPNGGAEYLFVGYTNTFYGSVLPKGFIKRVQERLGDVETTTIALPSSQSADIVAMLKQLNSNVRYESVFLFIEPDAILSHYGDSLPDTISEHIDVISREIETIISVLKGLSKDVKVYTLLFHGEASTENELESHFEQWKIVIKRITAHSDLSLFDFSLTFEKVAEDVNIDDLEHSVLTHEGNILNDHGHLVIANELLRSMGKANLKDEVVEFIRQSTYRESHPNDMRSMQKQYAV